MKTEIFALLFGAAGLLAAWLVWARTLRLKRAEAIRTYKWPRGLLDKLKEKHPGLSRKDAALVSRGLRQFFIAYLMSGRRYVSMPSQIADDFWHEFILYTREYQAFCKRAFGGFLHHTPAVVLRHGEKSSNAWLRRVWWYTCKYENIDPYAPTRLPLLFALDAKLNVPNGFRYDPDCEKLRRDGVTAGAAVHCGGDFSSTAFDGGTEGLGDGNGGGDGDGSGCGGGGD